MALKQTEVRGIITLPTDQPATIQSVAFTLMNSDWEDGEWVAKHTVTAVPGTDGSFTISLWPNDAGDRGDTRYSVAVTLANGASVDPVPNLYVRELPAGQWHEMDDLILEQTVVIAGYTTRVMTTAQYAQLETYTPGTLYLVRL